MNFHGGYFGVDHLIDFSINIPPLPYPKGLREELIKAIDQMRHYPEIDGESARLAISARTGVHESQLILGNGATELIYLFSRSVKTQKALILEPTFTEYKRALELNNIEVITLSHQLGSSVLNGYTDETQKQSLETTDDNLYNEAFKVSVDLDAIIETINKESVDLLVLCNPNNPTGHFYDKEFIDSILKGVSHTDFKLFIDESFLDFVSSTTLNNYETHILSLVNEYNIFLLRSMTKNFEVPGLRIGYGIGTKQIIEAMYKYKEPWSLNGLALSAIPFLMTQTEHLKSIKDWCTTEYDFLYHELSKIPCLGVYKSTANFLLLVVPEHLANQFFSLMMNKGIFIRKCQDFMGLDQKYYRVAIRERNDNKKLIKAIMEVLNENENE